MIEERLLELQSFNDLMLASAIEQGLFRAGQSCRYLSWERLDREALIACSLGIGAAALGSFCRITCQGARRAGLPDLMLWRNVDGRWILQLSAVLIQFFSGVYSARAVEVKGPRDSVRDEQRLVSERISFPPYLSTFADFGCTNYKAVALLLNFCESKSLKKLLISQKKLRVKNQEKRRQS